jgi:hypothetical protein
VEKTARSVAELLQKVYLAVGTVITVEEARALLNDAGAHFPEQVPEFTAMDTPDPVPPAISAPKIPELTAPSQNGNGGG